MGRLIYTILAVCGALAVIFGQAVFHDGCGRAFNSGTWCGMLCLACTTKCLCEWAAHFERHPPGKQFKIHTTFRAVTRKKPGTPRREP